MKKIYFPILLLLALFLFQSAHPILEWGFFGHRKINRMAVFTLPPDMMVFYKKNIEYVTDHAVDPDKRRYATKHEAVRHYIDLDIWGEYPFDDLPRTQMGVLMKYTDIFVSDKQNNSTLVFGDDLRLDEDEFFIKFKYLENEEVVIPKKKFQSFFYNNILPKYYDDVWEVNLDSFQLYFDEFFPTDKGYKIIAQDKFSEYGVLPFHLMRMQNKLTQAFEKKDVKSILRLSADFGHYIGDAHVPLHTTENYNGQLTNQIGIHAFWESRIPELFAEEEYDFFVGKAEYVENKVDYFWNIILSSHQLVDSVLLIEADMVKKFPEDKQFCFDNRNDLTVRTQCRAFAKAYSDRMKGMVEERMTSSVHSLGSLWYTAWVDAGQPDLSTLGDAELTEAEKKELEELENSVRSGEVKGREHN